MTLPAAVLSFAVVAGLLTVIPGLDTALVLGAAVAQGRRQGFATALGINTGPNWETPPEPGPVATRTDEVR